MGESSSGGVLTVGKYCYDSNKFANGAFGSIHHGWEKSDRTKRVVVKIVSEDQDARLQEAVCQNKLKDHKNIVGLLNYTFGNINDEERPKLILVLEYCNGGNLKDFTLKKGGKLKQKIINKYLLPQLRAGYKSMYDHDIVHRDVKLENIFLCHPDVDIPDNDEILYKFGDFGFARSVDGNQVGRACLGTPRYYAPELLRASRNPGSERLRYRHEPDMWAIGKSSFCYTSLNNRFLRERGMASTLKMEYQVFLCIFQNNSAMATKTKLRQPTGQNFFSTFPKEFSHFLQT